MSTLDPHANSKPVPEGRRLRLLLRLAVLSLAPYVVGVLVPCYVNSLDGLPLTEVAGGGHDQKDLWPQGPIGALVQLAGLASLAITPFGLVATLAGCVHAATARAAARTAPPWTALALMTLMCLAGLVLFFSPLGNALVTWRLD